MKVLGKLPVPGRPTILIPVGQGPTVLAVGAGGGCLDIFTLIYPFSSLSPCLWETTRYRLKYCLKGSLSPKTTNQPTNPTSSSVCLFFFLSLCPVGLPFLNQKTLRHGQAILVSVSRVRSSSYSPMAAWIFLRTSSLITWSLYKLFNSLR